MDHTDARQSPERPAVAPCPVLGLPRLRLAQLPTPFEPAPRFAAALSLGLMVLILIGVLLYTRALGSEDLV